MNYTIAYFTIDVDFAYTYIVAYFPTFFVRGTITCFNSNKLYTYYLHYKLRESILTYYNYTLFIIKKITILKYKIVFN